MDLGLIVLHVNKAPARLFEENLLEFRLDWSKLKTTTTHRLTSVLLVLTTKSLGYPILNRTQLEVGRDWGRMLVEVSQNPEHNLWNKNLYYVCNGMNWSGTERIVVIVQPNILLFFCARTISISQAYHNMFHMWNQQDISFGQVPPIKSGPIDHPRRLHGTWFWAVGNLPIPPYIQKRIIHI